MINIRASSLGELFDCPARWAAKNLDNLRMPGNGKAHLGTSLHASTAAFDASALDVAGFEFTGYSRGGPVFNKSDGVKGNLALGGELQKFRLGNEGDYGIEAELARMQAVVERHRLDRSVADAQVGRGGVVGDACRRDTAQDT